MTILRVSETPTDLTIIKESGISDFYNSHTMVITIKPISLGLFWLTDKVTTDITKIQFLFL